MLSKGASNPRNAVPAAPFLFALYGFRSEDRSSEGAHHLIVLRYDHRAPQFILKGPPNRLIGGNTS